MKVYRARDRAIRGRRGKEDEIFVGVLAEKRDRGAVFLSVQQSSLNEKKRKTSS